MPAAVAYLDASATPARRTLDLVARMTLHEKAAQLVATPLDGATPDAARLTAPAGLLHVRGGDLDAVAAGIRTVQERLLTGTRLGIPALPFADAPLPGEELGLPPLGLAASWDRELVQEVARSVAVRARAAGVRLLSGPALTVVDEMAATDPGTSFGGDPLLAAELVAVHVRGVQGTGGVGCAALELGAAAGTLAGDDGRIGERHLRSWVLPPARAAVLAGVAVVRPAATINGGVPLHADPWLLRTVLREEWGFAGAVLGQEQALAALHDRYRVAATLDDALALALEAGIDALAGAGSDGRTAERVVAMVRRGALSEWLLDDAVAAVLHLKFRLGLFEDPYPADARRRRPPRDATLLDRAVGGSAVLLSDPRSLLPVGDRRCRVVSLPGPDAATTGRGTALAAALRRELGIEPAAPPEPAPPEPELPAPELPAPAPDELTVVVVPGPPAGAADQVARVSRGGAPCVVLLCSSRLDGLGEILSTLSGVLWCCAAEAGGAGALAALLSGSASPAGRLPVAVTAGRTGAGAVLPLGHGLSYARFAYSNLRVAPAEPLIGEAVLVSCRVQNTGGRAAREVVQVYVRDRVGSVVRPERALAGFASVHLEPQEAREVRVVLPADRFALWDRAMRHVVEPGPFDVLVGPSASEVLLTGQFVVQPRDEPPPLS